MKQYDTLRDCWIDLFALLAVGVGKAFALGLTAFLIVLGARCGWHKAGELLELPARVTLEDIKR